MTFHNTAYPAIDPSLPHLSNSGRNIVITGGGSGIGREIAKAFATSEASNIALLGRTEATLLNTKKEIEDDHADTKVSTHVANMYDAESLEIALAAIKDTAGPIDILIANAGYLPNFGTLTSVDIDDWYRVFDTHIKSNLNLIRAFVPRAATNATVLAISTATVNVPYVPGLSAYHLSKVAMVKLFDYLHHEHSEFSVLSIHPEIVPTAMYQKQFPDIEAGFSHDDISLPAHFTVWAASPEAKFLNGKLVWAHWDGDEMKTMAEEIRSTTKFTLGVLGCPDVVPEPLD